VAGSHDWAGHEEHLTARTLVERWAAFTALLSQPPDVLRRLSTQPMRPVI
jgi:hypothetical protein